MASRVFLHQTSEPEASGMFTSLNPNLRDKTLSLGGQALTQAA